MQSAVDATIFGDAVVVFRPCVFPAGLELLEGNFVRGIPINLVGAKENEDSFRAVETSGF